MAVRTALTAGEIRFEAARRRAGLVLAPLSFALLWWLPLPSLTVPAHRLAAVATAVVVLWITEAIPLPVAALLGPAVAVVLGVAPAKEALAPFSDPLIFLFMGGFVLARGLSAQGFDRRAALWLLARKRVAGSPARVGLAIAGLAFAFSMWISNTATTAMLIPIALGLHATMAQATRDRAEREALDRFSGGMCLLLAYGANLGGICTPIGTGPNVIAMGMFEERGIHIDFLSWMAFAIPAALACMAAALVLGRRIFPAPTLDTAGVHAEVQRQLAELGPFRRGERRAVAIFALAIVGWLAPSIVRLMLGAEHPATAWADEGLREGVVAIVCASLLFVVRTGDTDRAPLLTWEQAERIDWGTLFLLGGGIALGKLAFDTGLARAIGEGVLAWSGPLARHPVGLLAASILLVIYFTELTSNSATTSMMLPVLIGVAEAGGFDPVPTALCATMAASCAFMLPVSTPPNAMAYGTGLLRVNDMLRIGLQLNNACFLVLVATGAVLLPAVLR